MCGDLGPSCIQNEAGAAAGTAGSNTANGAGGDSGDVSLVSESQVKKLLDPLSRDQLYAILLKLGLEYETVLNEIKAVAQRDPSRTKLFVRYVAASLSAAPRPLRHFLLSTGY